MGGNSFACEGSSSYMASLTPDKAFDNNDSTYWENGSTNPPFLGFYNPIPIKVSQIQVKNYAGNGYGFAGYELKVSNDGINYTQIAAGDGNTAGNAIWYVVVPENQQGFYKYYRIYSTVNGNKCIKDINITATYMNTAVNEIIFPCAFQSAPYTYSIAYLNGIFGNSYATSLTKTKMNLQNNSGASNVYYIAIGY